VPERGLLVATTCHGNDLQTESGSLPVENTCGNQVDTINKTQVQKERLQGHKRKREISNAVSTTHKLKNIQRETQVLGYVPIQAINLSLEEVKMEKHMYIGVASPIRVIEVREQEKYCVNAVRRGNTVKQDNFGKYLNEI
jgi:hypothetical protein